MTYTLMRALHAAKERRAEIKYDIDRSTAKLAGLIEELAEMDEAIAELERKQTTKGSD